MITKLRKENSLKTYRCCSDYAIEYIVPSIAGFLNNKYVVYKTARGIKPQDINKFRYINYKKACNMMMFFRFKGE